MAIYTNYNQINDYMKIASSKDSCWICAKKIGAEPGRDAYETLRKLEGAIENKPVIVIRRSGIDTCICMDCVKEVYDNHIAPNLPKEVKKDTNSSVENNEVIEEVNSDKEDKKSSKAKKDK